MWIKHPRLLTEKVIHFIDMAHVTMDFKQFHRKYLAHPSYNQNLILINLHHLLMPKKLFKTRHVLNDYEVKARMCQWVQTLSHAAFFVGIKQLVYRRKNISVSLVITATAGGCGIYFFFS
jgi:hypothetical protein